MQVKINMKIKFTYFLLIPFFLMACSKVEPQPQVIILNASPSGEVALLSGQEVNFEVLAEARNVKDGGDLTLVIQGADGTSLGMDGPATVSAGAPHKFSAKVKIPETSTVTIFVPYTEKGATETQVIDKRNYKVIGNAK